MFRAVFLVLFSSGCAIPLSGVASLTLLAAPGAELQAVPMGPAVTVKQCVKQVLGVVQWADVSPTHETVISQALKETGADVLLDAKITNFSSNYYVYSTACTQVEGTPAKLQAVSR